MNALSSGAALVSGCGLLWLSLIAKLADREATRIVWPVTGRFRRVLGPTVVSGAEFLIVAAALAPAPVALRLLPLGVCFAGYAIAATVLRGRSCACFGSWLPTRFSTAHAVACACVALLAFAGMSGLSSGTSSGLSVLRATGVAAGAVALASAVAAGLWWRSARRRRSARRQPVPDVHHFVVYVSDECPFCAALEAQRSRYEALTDKRVEFREAHTDEDAEQAGGGFPAAVGYDVDGVPVTEPVHGLSQIRDLLRRSTSPSELLRSAR